MLFGNIVIKGKRVGRMKDMIIYSGELLKAYALQALSGINKERDAVAALHKYITSPNDRRVCILYGLLFTGKTTMMLQEIRKIADFGKCLLMKCGYDSTIMQLREAIEAHPEAQYIFVDQVTKVKDFISAGSVLANKYAAEGRKIVLSGDDSLAISLAKGDELYDRARLIHTTYIPFKEHRRLTGKGLTEYIKYGGVLPSDNIFRSADTTNEYINSAVVFNIVRSLEKWNDRKYSALRKISDSDLPSFISKVIENIGSDMPDTDPECVRAVIEYLNDIDFLYKLPTLGGRQEYLFTQPGMIYARACAENFSDEQAVCGAVLEDIVLYQAAKASENSDDIFVSRYGGGVGKDTVLYISNFSQKMSCVMAVELYDNAYTYLTDEAFCSGFERKSGTEISAKVVIYNGETKFTEQQVIYINAEEYLLHSDMLIKALTENVISDNISFCKAMRTAGIKLLSQDGRLDNTD